MQMEHKCYKRSTEMEQELFLLLLYAQNRLFHGAITHFLHTNQHLRATWTDKYACMDCGYTMDNSCNRTLHYVVRPPCSITFFRLEH